MGKTRYARVKEVLDKLKLEQGEVVSRGTFNHVILTKVASSPQALKQVIMLLDELKMVTWEDDRVIIA